MITPRLIVDRLHARVLDGDSFVVPLSSFKDIEPDLHKVYDALEGLSEAPFPVVDARVVLVCQNGHDFWGGALASLPSEDERWCEDCPSLEETGHVEVSTHFRINEQWAAEVRSSAGEPRSPACHDPGPPVYRWWVRYSTFRALCLLAWAFAGLLRIAIELVEHVLRAADWRLCEVDRFCSPQSMPPPLWMVVAVKMAAPMGRTEALIRWYWARARVSP